MLYFVRSTFLVLTSYFLVSQGDIKFHPQRYNPRIYENAPAGTFVTSVEAFDTEMGVLSDIRYSINGKDRAYFMINAATGVLTTKKQIDRNFSESYEITVRAMSYHVRGLEVKLMRIYVTKENKHSPKFEHPKYCTQIHANAKVGTWVVRVKAHDKDPVDSHIYYAKDGSEEGCNFRLDEKSGDLYLEKPLNSEKNEIAFKIYGEDRGSPKKSSETKVEIEVIAEEGPVPEDEKAIACPENADLHIYENAPPGTYVGTVHPDECQMKSALCNLRPLSRPSEETYYRIIGVKDYDYFDIDLFSGRLTTEKIINRKPNDSYKLMILVLHESESKLLEVNVKVTVYNAHAPKFEDDVLRLVFRQDIDVGYSFQLLASDDDPVKYDSQILYDIEESGACSHFRIEETTGEVIVTRKVTHGDQSSIALKVFANDCGSPMRFTQSLVMLFFITGRDCNEDKCNNGVCEMTDAEPYYRCHCDAGYYGTHCENTGFIRVEDYRFSTAPKPY